MSDILAILGAGGRLSYQVTRSIDVMLKRLADREHGGWEERTILGIDGKRRTVKVFPPAWLRRLEKAVAVGAFARKTPEAIAERIIDTPEPGTQGEACAS